MATPIGRPPERLKSSPVVVEAKIEGIPPVLECLDTIIKQQAEIIALLRRQMGLPQGSTILTCIGPDGEMETFG